MSRRRVIETLTAYASVSDMWAPDYRDRKAAAEAAMLAAIEAAADAGDRDALRVWAALSDERAYAALNASRHSRMHRTTPEYGPIVALHLTILQADEDGIPAGADTAWCTRCRTRRAVEETSDESTYEGRHEVGYHVTRLACGHEEQTEGRIIGASPGGEAAAEAATEAVTRRRLEQTAAAYDGSDL